MKNISIHMLYTQFTSSKLVKTALFKVRLWYFLVGYFASDCSNCCDLSSVASSDINALTCTSNCRKQGLPSDSSCSERNNANWNRDEHGYDSQSRYILVQQRLRAGWTRNDTMQHFGYLVKLGSVLPKWALGFHLKKGLEFECLPEIFQRGDVSSYYKRRCGLKTNPIYSPLASTACWTARSI